MYLCSCLGEVDIRLWALDQEIGDQPAVQQCAPVNADAKTRYVQDGRVRMLILGDRHIQEVEGEAYRDENAPRGYGRNTL